MTKNRAIIDFVSKTTVHVNPSNVVWIDGSHEQIVRLRKQAIEDGNLIRLNNEKFPGCFLHRSKPDDVARLEERTIICTPTKEEAGPTNNWIDPSEAYEKLNSITKDSYKGKTMYVIPFSMGEIGSPFSKIGVEITDSIVVVLNMIIMTRVGKNVLESIEEHTPIVKCMHACCDLDIDKRWIAHFPQDNTIISVNSAYGGNALLGKKCFALRIASYQARKEFWLAEHMLILGIENPEGEIKYVVAAFPSACGKTNMAMLIPPKKYLQDGYRIWCVGDDIAWLRIGEDGRLWAINPENGFFGVAPGTNSKTNKNALDTTIHDSIFTNVAHNLDDNTVWWEGLDTPAPTNALDWKGNKWNQEMGTPGAHPNSRFTSPATNSPVISNRFASKYGVPISAILFGGRRSQTTPLVCESRDWDHGVFVGSTIASEKTAAAAGTIGEMRRDPMAMLPFCGYNMADYFGHWINMGKLLRENAPKIFSVNWFRTDEDGKFIWPGFGDNLRVLNWILDRCDEKIDAVDSPIGLLPKAQDIDISGLDLTIKDIETLLNIDKDSWTEEVASIKEFYNQFGKELPNELKAQLDTLENNINKF